MGSIKGGEKESLPSCRLVSYRFPFQNCSRGSRQPGNRDSVAGTGHVRQGRNL